MEDISRHSLLYLVQVEDVDLQDPVRAEASETLATEFIATNTTHYISAQETLDNARHFKSQEEIKVALGAARQRLNDFNESRADSLAHCGGLEVLQKFTGKSTVTIRYYDRRISLSRVPDFASDLAGHVAGLYQVKASLECMETEGGGAGYVTVNFMGLKENTVLSAKGFLASYNFLACFDISRDALQALCEMIRNLARSEYTREDCAAAYADKLVAGLHRSAGI